MLSYCETERPSSRTPKILTLVGTIVVVVLVTLFARTGTLNTSNMTPKLFNEEKTDEITQDLTVVMGTSKLVQPLGHLAIGDIVGGLQVSDPAKFPFIVSLVKWGGHTCGGVIYNSNTIVSAAHCTLSPANEYEVHAGGLLRGAHEQVRKVGAIYNFPNYGIGSGFHPNDVSVIKLQSHLNFNSFVRAAKFCGQGQPINAGTPVKLMGWGRTCGSCALSTALLEADVNVAPDQHCTSLYNSQYNSANMICVGGLGASGSCRGDSGGPMIDGSQTVFGVTSWGTKGCFTDYPSVYTKLCEFMDWIASMA